MASDGDATPAAAAAASDDVESSAPSASASASSSSAAAPTEPWTTEQRLTKFYEKYVPEKVSDVGKLLEKYEGKEEKLFTALSTKYGPEPVDPYLAAKWGIVGDGDDDEGDLATGVSGIRLAQQAAAAKVSGGDEEGAEEGGGEEGQGQGG